MPDRRSHRGMHPGDDERFADARLPDLRAAVVHHGVLIANGYGGAATIEFVGNRFRLDKRQRQAVQRASCTAVQREQRRRTRIEPDGLPELWLDGFNVLTTVEAAMSGGAVLACVDGCARDLASMHGTWRRVEETVAAAAHIGTWLQQRQVGEVVWWLDAPVGNSGRLAGLLRELSAERGFGWRIEVVPSPDRQLAQDEVPIATADSGILDRRVRWANVARGVVEALPRVWWIPLDSVAVGLPGAPGSHDS